LSLFLPQFCLVHCHGSVWFHFLVYWLLFGLLSLVLDSACLLDLRSHLALDITVCLVIDLACLDYDLLIKLAIGSYTLPTSPAHYRILCLPEIQRLFGIQIIMDPTSRLFRLRQGNRRVEDFVVEFCELCHLVDFNDVALKDIFRVGLNDPIRSWLPGGKIHWSLERYIDHALYLSGSTFTVGVTDEGPHDPPVPTKPKPAHAMPVKPKSAKAMSTTPVPPHTTHAKPQPAAAGPAHAKPAAAGPAHAKPAAPGPAPVMAARPESAPVMAALLQPAHKMAAISKPVHKMAAIPEPVHKMAAFPEPVHKMAAVPEPVHKMAATPKPVHKMAAVPEPLHKMVAVPKPCFKMAHVLDSPLMVVWAAKMALPHVMAATPDSSQAAEPSQAAGASSESSQPTAV
ncbi:hypothetical protein M9458_008140, partial [Cirrhinus mrigala]